MKVKFIALLLCLPFLSSSQSITDSLLIHYPMNGSANDVSGNNFHGTINGAVLVPDRFGNPNSAYYFDGINDYIEFPLSSALKPTYPMTFSYWVNIDALTSPLNILVNTDYVLNDYFGVGMAIDYLGNLQISMNGGNGFCNPSNRITFKSTTVTVVPGVWYSVVGVLTSPTDMDLYLNCIDANATYHSGTGPTTIGYTNSAPGNLGRNDGGGPPNFFYGYMDEFRYWNRALSPVEIASFCESGNQSWDCINGICIDPGTGLGLYTSLSDCQNICKPTALNDEVLEEKILIRVVDILGKEVFPSEVKGLLFFIYNDGSVEKKSMVE